jgi:hypothetical protein
MNKVITDQSDWDELIDIISDKGLTPVIGKEMYSYKDKDSLLPIDTFFSQKLFEENKITDQAAASLTDTVNYLENEKKQKTMDVIRKLKSFVKDISFDFPLLNDFLQIKNLNYFINTAVYNSVLENIIGQIKKQPVTSVNFSISEEVKSSVDLENLEQPLVFNVFGSLLTTVDPAISEEDLQEYAWLFKEKMSGATNIINVLKNRHLLFLGCTFPEGMTRFILRMLTNEPMHEWGTKRTIIIVNNDSEFRKKQLEVLKYYDIVTYGGSTADFVQELSQQWKKRNPEKIKNKIVFLSYTRTDKEAVENLKKGIEKIGNVTCWYDAKELEPGDDWREKIVVNIREADLFMPLISANSLDHDDGYVQKEWEQGTNEWVFRNHAKKEGKYLVPVVIDDSKLYNDKLAKFFDPNINIEKIPQGNPDDGFLDAIKKILNLA